MKGFDPSLEDTSMLFNLHLRWKYAYKNQMIQMILVPEKPKQNIQQCQMV